MRSIGPRFTSGLFYCAGLLRKFVAPGRVAGAWKPRGVLPARNRHAGRATKKARRSVPAGEANRAD